MSCSRPMPRSGMSRSKSGSLKLREFAETTPFNRVELARTRNSASSPPASPISMSGRHSLTPPVLKLGLAHPLPEKKIREFAGTVKNVSWSWRRWTASSRSRSGPWGSRSISARTGSPSAARSAPTSSGQPPARAAPRVPRPDRDLLSARPRSVPAVPTAGSSPS